ncbi:ethylene receptor 2-like [Canna indica]|uniref:histidine kinase n=1 Tax=Canna indica TaxID=4628 RepID=A0AAQ3QJF6_9LILI|nr:ethylene receptor 2-like [Canna indica]
MWSFWLPSLSARCGECVGEDDPSSFLSIASIHQYWKAADLLIALAYFSIPLELFYFVTRFHIFPFRWVILQFGAFIVLCGLTHLLAAFTYEHHSFLLFLALSVLKFLTALVSVTTAVSLLRLIPQLLGLFVREGLLCKKARELDRDLGLMRQREVAAWRLPMLTADIRRSLDRNTILATTLVRLSDALSLLECAIWMPNSSSSMSLTHQLHHRLLPPVSVSTGDADVMAIISCRGVVILGQNSNLVRATVETEAIGTVAATRVPLLKVSNFGGGAADLMESPYAILVAVLPHEEVRIWTSHELETLEVVAGQVAVALSHAAILEESLLLRKKLLQQNLVLRRARHDALLAREARESFRRIMTQEIIGPIRSVGAALSLLQLDKLSPQQLGMVNSGLTLFSLIEEAADISQFEGLKHY